jgi:hypothetical protein
LLGFVADDMRKRGFRNLARKMRLVAGPVAESRAETVNRHGVLIHPAQEHFHRHDGKRPSGALARKDKFARPRLGQLFEDGEGAVGKRNAMLARGLHALGGNRPDFLPQGRFRLSRA